MKIDEEKFKKFCEENCVDKHNEGILRKFCLELALGNVLTTSNGLILRSTRDKVKYLRGKGYTQEETAELAGISSRTVRRYDK